jgi:hypothetical protein
VLCALPQPAATADKATSTSRNIPALRICIFLILPSLSCQFPVNARKAAGKNPLLLFLVLRFMRF